MFDGHVHQLSGVNITIDTYHHPRLKGLDLELDFLSCRGVGTAKAVCFHLSRYVHRKCAESDSSGN